MGGETVGDAIFEREVDCEVADSFGGKAEVVTQC